MNWVTFTPDAIKQKFMEAFDEKQASVLTGVIYDSYQNLVKTDDFSELKDIVKDLAVAQKRTEIRMEELAEAQKRTENKVEELAEAQKRTENKVEELAEAQKRTEIRMEELTEAQKRTEIRMEELAEAQKRTEVKMEELTEAHRQTELEVRELTKMMKATNIELGGLSRSMSYALENEAYRMVPKALKDRYGIEITEKLIRTELGDEEINLLGQAMREGKEVWIVGETKLQLSDRRYRKFDHIFETLEKKVQAVKAEYGEVEIVRVLITHFAGKALLKEAQSRDVIVLQSFDW